MTPTSDRITLALDALRADAADWERAATDLRAAAARAAAEAVPAGAFSFAGQAAAGAYESLRVKTTALLEAGAQNFQDIAGALRTSADAYEADENAHVHALQNVY